jgi:hypothetical protein
MTSTAPSRPIGGRTRRLTAPAMAGVAYLVAWVTGLAVWPSNLDVAASGSQVIAAYTGHRGVAMLQSLLVHGVAGVALAIVVLSLGQAARGRDAGPLTQATVVAGVGAAAVSLLQCALGLLLAGWAVPDGDSGRAGSLSRRSTAWTASRCSPWPPWRRAAPRSCAGRACCLHGWVTWGPCWPWRWWSPGSATCC